MGPILPSKLQWLDPAGTLLHSNSITKWADPVRMAMDSTKEARWFDPLGMLTKPEFTPGAGSGFGLTGPAAGSKNPQRPAPDDDYGTARRRRGTAAMMQQPTRTRLGTSMLTQDS